MALSRLAQYSASYTAQDDDRALEAAGFAWAQAAGYDVPYDVAGCVGRLQVLGGKRKVWDASQRRQVVAWVAAEEMHRICAVSEEEQKRERERRGELDPAPDDPAFEASPAEPKTVEPARKPSRLLGLPERLLMREKTDEQKRERD